MCSEAVETNVVLNSRRMESVSRRRLGEKEQIGRSICIGLWLNPGSGFGCPDSASHPLAPMVFLIIAVIT